MHHVQFVDWGIRDCNKAARFSNGKIYVTPSFIFTYLKPLAYYDLRIVNGVIAEVLQEYVLLGPKFPTVEE